jgi:hypothetical protein
MSRFHLAQMRRNRANGLNGLSQIVRWSFDNVLLIQGFLALPSMANEPNPSQ